MNARAARKFLALHLEDANEHPSAQVQKAVKALSGSPDLLRDYERQAALDKQGRKIISEAVVPEQVEKSLADAVSALPSRRFHPRDPAILAAALGFLLLVVVLVWNFLGRPAAFPADAAQIAEAVIEIDDEPYEPVGEPAGELADWFLMKGFDNFEVPEHLAAHPAESGGLLQIQNQDVAVVTAPGLNARFVVFEAAPFGIDIPPGEWRTARIDPTHAAAIRQKGDICFMILRKGSLASVQDLLGAGSR
jgi:hypothetical protein